jgi:hypothetical protein
MNKILFVNHCGLLCITVVSRTVQAGSVTLVLSWPARYLSLTCTLQALWDWFPADLHGTWTWPVLCRHYEIGSQMSCPVPEPDLFFAGTMRLVHSWPSWYLNLTCTLQALWDWSPADLPGTWTWPVLCRHYGIGPQLTCPVPEPDLYFAGTIRLIPSWPAQYLSLTCTLQAQWDWSPADLPGTWAWPVLCSHYEIDPQLTCPQPEHDLYFAGTMRLVPSWPARYLNLTRLSGSYMTRSPKQMGR